jgi:hypothetical protein
MQSNVNQPTTEHDSYDWYYRGFDRGRTETLEQIIGTLIECLVNNQRYPDPLCRHVSDTWTD